MITGGTGFLGAALARYLVVERHESKVVLFDRNPRPEAVEDVADAVSVVRGDIAESSELVWAARTHRVDCIAHMASAAGVPAPGRVAAYVRHQCMGATNVFECARLLGITRVINASSVAVWGDQRQEPVAEDHPVRPRNLYGAHKLWSEHLAEHYNSAYEMEIISLRMGAVFGLGRLDRLTRLAESGLTPDLRRNRPHFMTGPELAKARIPIVMPPDDQVVDFLYNPDNAYAWWLALTIPRPAHTVFNLRGQQLPAAAMTAQLRRLLPDAHIEIATEQLDRDQLMDTSRIAAELNFVPQFSLEEALVRLRRSHPGRSTPWGSTRHLTRVLPTLGRSGSP